MNLKKYIFIIICLLGFYNFVSSQSINNSSISKNDYSSDSIFAYNLYTQAIELYKFHDIEQSLNNAEKSFQIASDNNLSILQINSALLIAQIYLKKDLVSYTLKYFLKALEISKKIDDKNTQTQVFIDIALIYFKLNIYDKAYEYLLNAYNIQKELPDNNLKIKTQEYLITALIQLKKYQEALDINNKNIAYFKTKSNNTELVKAYNTQIDICKRMGNHKSALEYNLKINEIYKTANNQQNLISTYNNIGYNYIYLKEYKNALSMFLKAFELANTTKQEKEKITILINIGICYQNLNDYDNALLNLIEAQKIEEKNKNPEGLARVQNLIALIYYYKNDNYNATIHSLESIEKAEKSNALSTLQNCYETYSKICQSKEEYEDAFLYYKKYLNIRDSLLVEQRIKEQNLYYQQYNLEKSEKELKLLMADKEMNDLTMSQLKLEAEKNEKELEIIKRDKTLQEYEKERAIQILTLAKQKHEAELREREIKSLQQEKEIQTFKIKQNDLEQKEKQKTIELVKRENELQKLAIDKQNQEKKNFQRFMFLFVIIFSLILGVFIYVLKSNKKLQKQKQEIQLKNVELEQKNEEIYTQKENLQEANNEIQLKNDVLESKNEQIVLQRDQILEQIAIIEENNTAITDSIRYARRIQNAMLKPTIEVEKKLPEHFILFKPRDIVSGDFYWIREVNDYIIFAAVDCTGHGVPGALMSTLGVAFLNEIVHRKEIKKASQALDELRRMVISFLQQTEKDSESHDGMDIALCVIHPDRKKMDYAGAFNPLYIIRNGELIEHKADRMPIGSSRKENKPFTNHEIDIFPEDKFYIFSDGYIDQFGDFAGNCYMPKRLKEKLLSINEMPMKEQFQLMEDNFNQWKGTLEQLDDVLLIGIKI